MTRHLIRRKEGRKRTPVAYGDADDQLDHMFVATQMSRGKWDDIDRNLVRSVLNRFGTGDFSIDAGAGTGRLLGTLSAAFVRVLAVEPDVFRFRSLCKQINTTPSLTNCIALNAELEVVTNCRADFALCSHVIQHLPFTSLHLFLSCLAEQILRPRGTLLLTTVVANEPGYYLTRANTKKTLIAEAVTTHEFDEYAADPVQATLPVRHYTEADLIKQFRSAGFRLIWARGYRPFTFLTQQYDSHAMVRLSATDTAFLLTR